MEDLVKAFTIFLKYSQADFPTTCEHDILYVNVVDPNIVSEEDKAILSKLGFEPDEDINGFSSTRFGSN